MDDTRTLTIRPPVWLPIIVAVIASGAYIMGKTIEVRDQEPPTITVTGEAREFAPPDIAELSFGIQTGRLPTHKAAMTKLTEGMKQVIAAVKKAGVEEKDIRTEYFSLQPINDWTQQGTVFRGFEGSQSLRVKVRDLDAVSDVLAAATEAGANQANSVNFTIDEPEAIKEKAREKAIEQAQEKAQKLAKDLGMSLGVIRGFSEGYGGYNPPMPMMMRAETAMDAGMVKQESIPAGEQEVTVSVTITYELE
ncbi:MAG: SIMPL domain-containing protein [Candidatus Peregrinibacteria bacterium]|nr:SIMPL domain-containing protein [Candidatus Peregrinibacteria bacterium]